MSKATVAAAPTPSEAEKKAAALELEMVRATISETCRTGHPKRRFSVDHMAQFSNCKLPAGYPLLAKIERAADQKSEVASGDLDDSLDEDIEKDAPSDVTLTTPDKEGDRVFHPSNSPYSLVAAVDIPANTAVTFFGGRWLASVDDKSDADRTWYDTIKKAVETNADTIRDLNHFVKVFGEHAIIADHYVVPQYHPSGNPDKFACGFYADHVGLKKFHESIVKNNHLHSAQDFENFIRDSNRIEGSNAVRVIYADTMLASLRTIKPVKRGETIVAMYPIQVLLELIKHDESFSELERKRVVKVIERARRHESARLQKQQEEESNKASSSKTTSTSLISSSSSQDDAAAAVTAATPSEKLARAKKILAARRAKRRVSSSEDDSSSSSSSDDTVEEVDTKTASKRASRRL